MLKSYKKAGVLFPVFVCLALLPTLHGSQANFSPLSTERMLFSIIAAQRHRNQTIVTFGRASPMLRNTSCESGSWPFKDLLLLGLMCTGKIDGHWAGLCS